VFLGDIHHQNFVPASVNGALAYLHPSKDPRKGFRGSPGIGLDVTIVAS